MNSSVCILQFSFIILFFFKEKKVKGKNKMQLLVMIVKSWKTKNEGRPRTGVNASTNI